MKLITQTQYKRTSIHNNFFCVVDIKQPMYAPQDMVPGT